MWTLTATAIISLVILRLSAAQHGLLILHGLGGDSPAGSPSICDTIIQELSLDDAVAVFCPQAGYHPHSLMQSVQEFLPFLPGDNIQSWFDFKRFPADAVDSQTLSSSTDDLKDGLDIVNYYIKYMIEDRDIPSENIVVSGPSQGGALALYAAVHTKYKLGGFMVFVTWYPNLRQDPPRRFHPVNRNTPILHLNGYLDPMVSVYAGDSSARELRRAFSEYTIDYAVGSHFTLLLPVNQPTWYIINQWLKEHKLLGKSSSFERVEDRVKREGIFKAFWDWW
eukprot:GFUD01017888.1.p1 GENE.GFUD01017888.1~~GFUD01017888.1.p1  ORF type:complete len:297 (-),score=32.14 GFUD01017888.1:16-855(-)